MANIRFSDVSKAYGRQPVIHGIDASIEDGEFAVLVGPSGCGKSTLLRMLAGLESITGGDVHIGDVRVNDLLPKERNIAMVFQNYALYPHMTVAENLGFSLRLAKAPAAEKEEKVGHAARILGLSDLLDRYPRQLSGGQRQRVAMGRAIVRDPAVFLFDEPLSNLDAKLRVQMRTEIKALHQKLQSTIVYVTHDQIEAMTMADKIFVLNAGRIAQVGSPLELYDRPANRFVATFIGSPSMNILPITVANESQVVLEDGQHVTLTTQQPQGRKLLLGLRPEHTTLAAGEQGFNARVEVVEPTGAETHVSLTVAGSPFLAALRDHVPLGVGDSVKLTGPVQRYYLFDAETELSLPLPQQP